MITNEKTVEKKLENREFIDTNNVSWAIFGKRHDLFFTVLEKQPSFMLNQKNFNDFWNSVEATDDLLLTEDELTRIVDITKSCDTVSLIGNILASDRYAREKENRKLMLHCIPYMKGYYGVFSEDFLKEKDVVEKLFEERVALPEYYGIMHPENLSFLNDSRIHELAFKAYEKSGNSYRASQGFYTLFTDIYFDLCQWSDKEVMHFASLYPVIGPNTQLEHSKCDKLKDAIEKMPLPTLLKYIRDYPDAIRSKMVYDRVGWGAADTIRYCVENAKKPLTYFELQRFKTVFEKNRDIAEILVRRKPEEFSNIRALAGNKELAEAFLKTGEDCKWNSPVICSGVFSEQEIIDMIHDGIVTKDNIFAFFKEDITVKAAVEFILAAENGLDAYREVKDYFGWGCYPIMGAALKKGACLSALLVGTFTNMDEVLEKDIREFIIRKGEEDLAKTAA